MKQFITSAPGNRIDAIANTAPIQTPTKQKLPEVLRTRDMTVFMLLIVLFISNVTGVQFGGPAALLYWGLGILTIMLPGAYATRWLANRYPGQNASFIRTAKTLGSNLSFLLIFFSDGPGVFFAVAAMVNSVTFIRYLEPGWFSTSAGQGIAMMVMLLIATAVACLPLKHLKNILLVLATLYLSIYLLLGAAGVWWLASGHAAASSFATPAAWQFNGSNFGVFGIVILALLGVHIPLLMSAEIRGGKVGIRRATTYLWWGTLLIFLAYGVGTFGVMVIMPRAQAGELSASVRAIQVAFGPLAGQATALILAVSHIAISIAYILIFSRLSMLAAKLGHQPVSLLNLNRHGVPIRSIVIQGAITVFITFLLFVVVPGLVGAFVSPANLVKEIYSILLADASTLWALSVASLCLIMFWFTYRRLRKAKVSQGLRLFTLINSLVGIASVGIGIWVTISTSWIPTLLSNERWAVLVGGTLVFMLALSWLSTEISHLRGVLGEQTRLHASEVQLRSYLQESYDQQQVLLAELDRLYREQSRAAITDAVTGLPNHRAIMSRLDEELSHCRRAHTSCAVLFIDLDLFKRVNDTYGHRVGDAILREVGSRLSIGVRLEDFVGRYGGEEFAVILTDTDLLGASQLADRLLTALNSQPCYWELDDVRSIEAITISGSIGVSVYLLHGVTREELIESADRAMYQAKHDGRNRVCIADVEVATSPNVVTRIIAPPSSDEELEELVGLHALTAVAAARDSDTYLHAHRLVEIAVATARKLHQSEHELHMLRLSAILHDIGKIGIPDAILHKPGPLTEEEWIVMRTHPEIGRQILLEIGGAFGQLAKIVVAHQERWDGNGYPNGLAGEAIPMHARILTVVDSFDAMTSRRVYREPMSIEAARTELLRCSGSQFDPHVVEAFLQVLDEQTENEHDKSQFTISSGGDRPLSEMQLHPLELEGETKVISGL
jgi:diguanylate cyclase (GGDEF)-like protein